MLLPVVTLVTHNPGGTLAQPDWVCIQFGTGGLNSHDPYLLSMYLVIIEGLDDLSVSLFLVYL
jgi:hypothetical protein